MCGRNLAKPRVFIVFVLFLTRAMDLRLFSGRDYTFICGWSEPTAGSASLVSLLFIFFYCWTHIVWKRQSPAISFIII